MAASKPFYRVQISGSYWILRHPEQALPLLKHNDKEEVIKQLPLYFKRTGQKALVKIMDDFGRIMEEREFDGGE